MRDFGAVVGVPVRDVDHGRHHDAAGCWVAPQLVRDQPARDTSLALQQLPEESDSGAPIPARLHEDVEDVAVLVDGAPQILSASLQRHKQLVEMPRVAHPTTPLPKPPCVDRTKPLAPLPNSLVGDDDASLIQQIFHIPEAEPKAMIQPDGMTDDRGRKPIAVIAWAPVSPSAYSATCGLKLTVPQDALLGLAEHPRRFRQAPKHHVAPGRIPRRRGEDAAQVVTADEAGLGDLLDAELLGQVVLDVCEGSVDRVHGEAAVSSSGAACGSSPKHALYIVRFSRRRRPSQYSPMPPSPIFAVTAYGRGWCLVQEASS